GGFAAAYYRRLDRPLRRRRRIRHGARFWTGIQHRPGQRAAACNAHRSQPGERARLFLRHARLGAGIRCRGVQSSTARLQSGGVGSTINIKTARPFDYAGFKFAGSTDVNYEENSNKAAPDASFLISDRFADGRFGILLSGSYQLRKDRLNQAQTDGWIVNGGTPSTAINGGAGVQLTAANPQGN